MRFNKATDGELWNIINNDKGCPALLLSGIVEEMIRRDEIQKLVTYTAKMTYGHADYVVKNVLKMDWKELFHVLTIEIYFQSKKFKEGMRTPKTFFIMCLKSKLLKMRRDVFAEVRKAHVDNKYVDELDEKLQERLFFSPNNVEKYVLTKMELEEVFSILNEKEKKALHLYMQGFTQYEIADALGFKHKTHGNTFMTRIFRKIRRSYDESRKTVPTTKRAG